MKHEPSMYYIAIIASPYSRDRERQGELKTSAAAANKATLDSNTATEDDSFEYMCISWSAEEQAFNWGTSEFVHPDEHCLHVQRWNIHIIIASSAYMY